MRHLWTIAVLVCAVACSDRRVPDDTDLMPDNPQDLDQDVGAADDHGEVVCREGLTLCNGKCVDTTSDDQHCAACHHECKYPYDAGHCVDSECPSAPFCAAKETGVVNCHDVCALHGQTCDEGPREGGRGCGGGHDVFFAELGHSALELCEWGIGSLQSFTATCDEPIDWSTHGGFENNPSGAVACCCTQEPPP
jgi:hypothetical protein